MYYYKVYDIRTQSMRDIINVKHLWWTLHYEQMKKNVLSKLNKYKTQLVWSVIGFGVFYMSYIFS